MCGFSLMFWLFIGAPGLLLIWTCTILLTVVLGRLIFVRWG